MAFISWAKARREPVIRDLATSPDFNEQTLLDRMIAEAAGNATFARRAPGTDGNLGDLTLQVDVALAVSNALVLT